jgi:hypothetical protein
VSGHRPWAVARADARRAARRAALRAFLDWARHERGWFLAHYPAGSASEHPVALPLDHDRVLTAYAAATDAGPVAPDPDRPRYRVLARPFHDHEPDARPEHPDGVGHDRDCAAGHELLVFRVDASWRAAAGAAYWEPLGVTQTTGRGGLDAADARDAVCDYVRLRSEPRASGIAPADVELYAEVTDR